MLSLVKLDPNLSNIVSDLDFVDEISMVGEYR